MLIKLMRNEGYTLKEIREMDAYEVMLNLGFILYDNEEVNDDG